MDISSVNSDLIRGNATTIILTSLWSNDRYGYEILQEIDEKSHGQYKLKQATLYNQLKKLEKAGLISSYDGAPDDTGGGRRRYYSLTAEGRAFLSKEKREYEYSRTILDKLVSSQEFDLETPAPFDTDTLRPYTKTGEEEDKPKIVYKEKIVEKEVPVEIVKEVPVEVVKEVEIIKTVPVEVVKEVEKLVEKRVFLDAEGNEISEEEAARLAEERKAKAARAAEAMKPAMTLEELFARMDADSEYKKQEEGKVLYEPASTPIQKEPEQHSYFNAYASENESRTRSESTLKEVFERLEKKEAEIDAKTESQAVAAEVVQSEMPSEKQFYEAELEDRNSNPIHYEDKGQFVTSAVISKRDEKFEYEKENVNYRDFFSSIVDVPAEKDTKEQEKRTNAYADADLKTRLYAEGFKIRPYDRGNTSEYYTFNFLQSNRINRDCWLLVLALFVLEVGVMWVSLINRISYTYFLPVLLCPAALMLVPSLVYLINPVRRTRANFNFKLSVLNRGMMFIELTVVCVLIGFFAVGASVGDLDLILETIIIPMILLTNLPVSSVAYWLLYRSRKYHVA